MNYYKIFLLERWTGEPSRHNGAVLVREKVVNNGVENGEIGIFFYLGPHMKKSEVTSKVVRNHMIGIQDTFCIIGTTSFEMAVSKFLKTFKGALVGGETWDRKALYINSEEVHFELPSCERLHLSSRRQFICGEENVEDGNGNGEFGGCVLAGYDPPEDCPIQYFYHLFRERKKIDALPIDLITPLEGPANLKLVRAKNIMTKD